MPGGCSDRTGAGKAAKEKPATACGKTEEPCPLSQETKPYYVELRVVTRAGEIPVKGVKASIDGKKMGSSDAKGEFKTDGKVHREKSEKSNLTIEATYENTDAKLKLEHMQFDLKDLDPDKGTKGGKVSNKIAKIQDVAGGADIDFDKNYSVSDKAEELVWTSAEDAKILKVTIKMATFSLQVPYVNQRKGNDTVETIKGKDPEPATHSHVVSPSFSGDKLCFPTCTLMLLKYWEVVDKKRGDVMQEIYKQWANDGFPGRIDKVQNLVPSSTAPSVNYPDEKFWLDSSTLHPNKGYILRKNEWIGDWKASTAFTWEVVPDFKGTPDHVGPKTPSVTTEGKTWQDTSGGIMSRIFRTFKRSKHPPPDYEGDSEPEELGEGKVWKNTSVSPPEFKKWVPRLVSPWPEVLEENWRILENGYRIWYLAYREEKALSALKPSGTSTKLGLDVSSSSGTLPNDLFTETYLSQIRDILTKGLPIIVSTSATTKGHKMVIRGCVVDKDCKVEWLILNDPYGNLASPGSIYEEIDIDAAVGRNKRGNPAPNNEDDVKAVQEVLKATGDYKGAVNGTCSGKRTDPVVKAIRKFQISKRLGFRDGRVDPDGKTEEKMKSLDFSRYRWGEKEINAWGSAGEKTMRGKHVYYNKYTHGKGDKLIIKGGQPFLWLKRDTEFTKAEIGQKLVPSS
ncbi:MAG: hypothetical protein ACETWQ_22745 [Phycisphaerae bacterium]